MERKTRGKSPRPTPTPPPHTHTQTHTHHVDTPCRMCRLPISRNHPKEPFFSLCERAIGEGAGTDRAGCKEDGRGKMQAGLHAVESTGPSAEERCTHGVMHRSAHVGSARARALRSAGALGRPEPSRPPGACLAPRRHRAESGEESGWPRDDSRASRRGRRGRPGWRGGGRSAVRGKPPAAPEGGPGCERGSGVGCAGVGLAGVQAVQRVDLALQLAQLRAQAVGRVDEHERERAQVDLQRGGGRSARGGGLSKGRGVRGKRLEG